ncbi:MAG: EamA family transporter [Candidatus Lokiarchaeota archaeon]|nr:EamA family transporter [Candidatus Lokiarchaeota archaeon]MBD3201681.1 EamA family transporter [Candidatus Lokiarchaeota archaeon]
MKGDDFKKGIIYGAIGIFIIGLQPIIANSRPAIIDPYIFAAITALIEASIFLPIFLFERKEYKKKLEVSTINSERIQSLLNGWKKKSNLKVLFVIGVTFSIVPVLLYIGYELAGSILSGLALKTEVIFALIFGRIILNEEKISKLKILFFSVLFLGLIIAMTQGSLNIIEFNMGVLIIIISVIIFTFIHTITKIKLDAHELFASQVVFIRNLLSGTILFLIYIIIFPIENLLILLDPMNLFFFLIMGFDYGFSLFVWYKTLSYIEISKASIINSLTPIISSLFGFLLLGDLFTLYHFVGLVLIIVSIYMIVREPKSS